MNTINLTGLLGSCEDWVKQIHQIGLKNYRQTKMIRDRGQTYKLYTHWYQLNGNCKVQMVKKEVRRKQKRNLDNNTRGAETAAALLDTRHLHHEAYL